MGVVRSILHEATKDHEEHEGFFLLKVFVIFVILRDKPLRPRPSLGLALGSLPFRPGERFVTGLKRARDNRLAVVRDVDLDAVRDESRKAGDSAAFSAQCPQRGRLIVHAKKRTTSHDLECNHETKALPRWSR